MNDEDVMQQQAMDDQMEIRRKIGFMISTVKELMIDGLISDFSILESSLEQVFKECCKKAWQKK